jgi:predicted nuclease with TOPRIM domain
LLQQKTEVENEAYESQSKCSQFKLEIVRLDKENMMLDDRLIEKERELERLRGELSVMERMFGNIGNRPINNQNNQIKKQETVTSYEYLATPNMANNSKLR